MANLTVKEVINSLWTKVKEKTDTVSKEVSDLSKRVDGINLTIPEPFLRNTQQTTDYVYQRIARIIVDNIEIDETGKR